MKNTPTWIRYLGLVGLVISLGARAEVESEEPNGHVQSENAAVEAPTAPTTAPVPGKPAAPAQPAAPAKPGRDLRAELKANHCGDAIMKKATALLYAAGSAGFAEPQAEEKRRQFIESNFSAALQLKVTKYRNKRPRYFEVAWPFPGLETKFQTVRYTLDSPTGNFTGQKEDVVKVEPIDPKTGAPMQAPPGPQYSRTMYEICRFNAYRCLHPNGCRWQPKETLSEEERVKGIATVKAYTDALAK